MLTDIHTHNAEVKANQCTVLSIPLHPDNRFIELEGERASDILISAGVHPWHAVEWSSANISIVNSALESSRVLLIGEVGLDNQCGVPIDRQMAIFDYQLILANRIGKPVLIHNVGFQSVLFKMKAKYQNIPAWILHGFRGKPEMAKQYLQHGFYLSFGMQYNPKALRICPLNRLLLESDDLEMDLSVLYHKVAMDLGLSVSELEFILLQNFKTLLLK